MQLSPRSSEIPRDLGASLAERGSNPLSSTAKECLWPAENAGQGHFSFLTEGGRGYLGGQFARVRWAPACPCFWGDFPGHCTCDGGPAGRLVLATAQGRAAPGGESPDSSQTGPDTDHWIVLVTGNATRIRCLPA